MSLLDQIFAFLFLISLGKSPTDLQEFHRIQGEWSVVSVQESGKKGDLKEWEHRKILFAQAGEKGLPDSHILQFTCELNSKKKPSALEKGTMTLLLPKAAPEEDKKEGETPAVKPVTASEVESTKIEGNYCAIFEVHGDTMKLLFKRLTPKKAQTPTKFVTVAGDDCFLMELRRIKPQKAEK